MIQQIWGKKVVAQISLSPEDVADEIDPLPLFLPLSWNHYLAFYYEQIQAFFSSYIVYPFSKDQFHLVLESQNLTLDGTQVVGNLITQFDQKLKTPLKFLCKFRARSPIPQIQIKQHFKYSLKASTAIRNQKLGASLMTLHMSIDNVEKMFQSFVDNDLKQYLGSNDFEGNEKLGYAFLVSKTQRVPIRIVGKDFVIERGEKKEHSLGKVLVGIFQEAGSEQKQSSTKSLEKNQLQKYPDEVSVEQGIKLPNGSETQTVEQPKGKYESELKFSYIFKKYSFYMQGVKMTRGEYPLQFFQRFCHPDGFLYIFFREN